MFTFGWEKTMHRRKLWPIAILFAASMTAVAWAQDAGPSPGGQVPGPNATPPGAEQNAPSAEHPAQPVPGAMAGSDTVPSTMSAEHAADDKLNITAYTFKNLTSDQRRAIYQALNGKAPSALPGLPGVSAELPASIELHAIPDALVTQVPQTKDYRFVQAGDKLLLVSPTSRTVAGEFGP
jgi:hypothetical protein